MVEVAVTLVVGQKRWLRHKDRSSVPMRTSIRPPKSPSVSFKFLRMGLRVMTSGSGGGVDGGSFGVTANNNNNNNNNIVFILEVIYMSFQCLVCRFNCVQ